MAASNLIITLVCGVPGSGKSRFCSKLLTMWTSRMDIAAIVSFDDLDVFEEWNDTTFKSVRNDGYEKISCLVQKAADSGCTLLIVDDIMYLRSMRRGVYKIARQYHIPLLTVWINTSLDVALSRNDNRQGRQRIPPETIIKIHRQFEAPSSSSSIVDRYCLTVDGDCEESITSGINECLERIRSVRELFHVESGMCTSEPPLPRTEQSTITFIGRLDGILRKIIAATIDEIRRKDVQLVARVGKVLSIAKAATLVTARKLNFEESLALEECKRIFLDEVEKTIGQSMDDIEIVFVCNVVCNNS